MRHLIHLTLVLALAVPAVSGQPRLIVPESDSYLSGESIDAEVAVWTAEGEKVRLIDLWDSTHQVVVLVLLGGAARNPESDSRRGGLWCEDSFDDLAVQRALVSWARDKPVSVIAVAIPDVLSPEEDGSGNILLEKEEDSVFFREEFSGFVNRTEKERASSILPFDRIFYDPRGKLILGEDSLGKVSAGYGEIQDWQGKFKWHMDPRTYGLPTVWILTGDGKIAGEPFWGNDYDSSPPLVSYGFRELKDAVESLLD